MTRNDDPTILYSRAWWIANGISATQILTPADRERRAQISREKNINLRKKSL